MTPGFLNDSLRLLLFGGKGGVGKTTSATASALRLARSAPQRSFRLISTDPAHSLFDSLDGCAVPGNLTVVELDAGARTNAFRAAERGRLHAIAAAGTFLEDSDIERLLDLSLPGLDELAAFLEISDSLEHSACDCVVVDTAPSGHTLRLLAMPANIRLWVGALDALLAKRRYMQQIFGRPDAGDPLELMVAGWNAALDRMESLLRDPVRCRFVPVTTAEALGVRETARLWKELQHLGVPVSDLIVNQIHPAGGCPTCTRDRDLENVQIARLAEISRPARLWTVELLPDEVRGERMLAGFWDHARLLKASEAEPPSGAAFAGPPIDPPEETPGEKLPAPESQFLLFSGKGGVGKTTLACVTALRLAREFPWKRILLLSTDPAHSLSGCLGIAAGPVPAPVLGNLEAMEIDAGAEFDGLRQEYELDVQEMLGRDSGSADLAFDRAAIAKTLELVPPGLDEVMALAGILDLRARDRYDMFILDSPSTGHLIRLLELPQIVEQWLETFFGLLLKYRRLLHLPRFTDRLIRLSKNLKAFRRILADPARLALYAVSIPTQMALDETKDLLDACERIGVSAPLIFLNRLTPGGNCRLCAALERRESVTLGRFKLAFPDRRLVLVYRQGELKGVDRLLRFADTFSELPDTELCHST